MVKKAKKGVKETVKKARRVVKDPVVLLWRSTVIGLLDLMTDVVFCMSLWRAAADGGDSSVGQLAMASAVLIGASTLFCGAAVIGLYFHMARRGAVRRLFALETKSLHKLAFFLVVLISATVNVRLAALLPWKQSGEKRIRSTGGRAKVLWRARVLRNILWLHMMHKLIEDLPQLVLAALFLGTQSGTQSD